MKVVSIGIGHTSSVGKKQLERVKRTNLIQVPTFPTFDWFYRLKNISFGGDEKSVTIFSY